MIKPAGIAMGGDMTPRKDRRFKQWNKTKIYRFVGPRNTNGHPPVDAFTYDLSIGGARLHTSEAFDIESLIRLEVELVRTEDVLRVEAVVKWQRWDEMANVYEMGVEFQHSSMVTVLSLMKNLHDGRRTAPSAKAAEPRASVSRS